MNQLKYVQRILDRFKMSECKLKPLPYDLSVYNENSNDSKELVDAKLHREIVGSLVYVMTASRPDLCYIITMLSQYMSNPTKANLNLAKHVLRYLKGTLFYDLKFHKANMKLIGYCDSDWDTSCDRRSITGYCYHLNSYGPIISWRSKKQSVVALSSCEAEYIALTSAIQEAKFLQQLFVDMQGVISNLIFCLPIIKVLYLYVKILCTTKDPSISIYHYIRLEIQNGNIDLICTFR